MFARFGARAGVVALATAMIVPLASTTAHADPLPADYSGSTHGDVLSLNLTAAGIVDLTAVLGHSATATDSTGDPRAHAESANLHIGAIGIPIPVATGSADSDLATPTDSYEVGLGQLDIPGILDTGVLQGTGTTTWAGDAACVADGAPIAQSTTSLAGADLGLTLAGIGLTILDVGTVQTAGQTALQGESVVSTSSGNIASLGLLNGLVAVEVLTNPTLTATSDGSTTTVTANDYAVAVTVGGQRTQLRAGMSIPLRLNIGVLSTNLTLSVGQVVDSSSGATAAGSMTFLRLSGAINGPLGVNLASLDFGLLPLAATATGAPGGVECDALDPPVITSPADGTNTADRPTITGTGAPGATVTVTEGGTAIGTAVVGPDGIWSLVPSDPLTPGDHTIAATQALDGAISGPSDAVTFTVLDTTAPEPPVITTPTDGTVTSDATPTIGGTAEPGSTVVVVDQDGNELGSATADPGGNWRFDVATPLADGPHTITATAIDAAGNTSGSSLPVTFVVDATAPEPPVVTGPADGSTIGDGTPTITGTGEPGATVEVTIDGTVVGTTTVGGDGTWSVDVPDPLADGEHTVTATQTDTAGNTSEPSAPVTFTVDTTVATPVIVEPTSGTSTTDPTPTISGTGDPGSTVTVIDQDQNVLGTAVVDPAGNWTFDSVPLDDGTYTITATQEDPAGNVSPASSAVVFTVDTTAPDAPAITSPDDGDLIADPAPTIIGTGEPGATVEVTVDGQPAGTTTVNPDGTWSLEVGPLDDGTYTVVATQTDAAGNTSEPSDPVTFTVDTTAPEPPVITNPTDGTTTGDVTPTISGTGEPGATVEVTVDGQVIGTAPVDASGNWTLDVPDPLDDGEHMVTATQTDAAGHVSDPTEPVTFTVDTTAPEPPTITSPTDGAMLTDPTPTISGTGEPGATVEVIIDGLPVGTVEVGPGGSWSIDPTEPLAEGEHSVIATQTDGSGNTSAPSDAVSFTIDTIEPEPPTITAPDDGSTIGDSTPTITGTGEPGATVEVIVDGTVVGTATVADDGTWSVVPSEPFPDGDHTVTATQTDPAGNVSEPSGPVTFTVDTTADAPEITGPADGVTIADDTPTITGTGEPGATVEIAVDGGVVGTTTVNPDGTWSFDLIDPLDDGDHTVTATQTDPAGNVSEPSDPVTFTVDTTAAAPVIDTPTSGTSTNDSTPTIAGTGEPGAEVTVIDQDGNILGTATVGDDGEWTLESVELADGTYTILATQEDPSGNVSPNSNSVIFTVDTALPDAPVVTGPADGSSTDDPSPTITGTGEPGAEVSVSIDGTVVGTTTVDPNGTWTLDLTEPLADGEHIVTAVQTDAAGNTSDVSDPVSFTVDTTAAAPAIETPASGSTTNDSTPVVSGTGEPGATVTVTATDGTVLGTATVGADGNWSFDSVELPDGTYTITATQTDPAGNTSSASSPVIFTVDTKEPAPPTITSPTPGELIDVPTPTITGTGEPGATVEVIIDGAVVGTTTVDERGNWRLVVSEPLAGGEHTVTATQTDPAGNTSPASEPVTFIVDTSLPDDVEPPDAPVIESPSDGDSIDDRTPTVSGIGEPGATVEVSVDGEPVGTTEVGVDGEWSLTLSELDCGTHEITATQTDQAGNQSEPSDPITVTVTCDDDGDGGDDNDGDGDGGDDNDGDGDGGDDNGDNGDDGDDDDGGDDGESLLGFLPSTGTPFDIAAFTMAATLMLATGLLLARRRRA